MKLKNILCFCFLIIIISCKEKTDKKIAEPSTPEASTFDLINKAIAADVYADSLYYQRAKMYYDNAIIDSVYSDLNRAIFLNPKKQEYYLFLSDTYLENAMSKEAAATLEKALSVDPTNKEIILRLAKLKIILQEYQLATVYINQVYAQDPQHAYAHYLSGHVYYETGDTARAINSYQRAVDSDPTLREAWIQLGDIMTERKNKLAINYYDNAIRLDSTDKESIFNKAYALQQLNRKPEAMDLYRSLCNKFPNYEPAFYNFGLMYKDAGDMDHAIEHFTISIGLNPMEASSYYHRGLCYIKQGKRVEAKADLSRAASLEPTWKEAKQALDNLTK